MLGFAFTCKVVHNNTPRTKRSFNFLDLFLIPDENDWLPKGCQMKFKQNKFKELYENEYDECVKLVNYIFEIKLVKDFESYIWDISGKDQVFF